MVGVKTAFLFRTGCVARPQCAIVPIGADSQGPSLVFFSLLQLHICFLVYTGSVWDLHMEKVLQCV